MSDHDALLSAILAHPDEDTPRLMFADWLQENGAAPRAEFVRLQIELARLRAEEVDLPDTFGTLQSADGCQFRPHDTAERIALLRRESELLSASRRAWAAELPEYAVAGTALDDAGFFRGFVGHVSLPLEPLVRNPDRLWERHPVESLDLSRVDSEARARVPECHHLERIRSLRFGFLASVPCEAEFFAPFVECPHLAAVRVFDLGRLDCSDSALNALADAPYLRPTVLKLHCPHVSRDTLERVLHAPFASRVRRFEQRRAAGWAPEVIATAPLNALRFLDLRGAMCGDAGARALAGSPHITELVTLDLSSNGLTNAALEALAAWPGLESVKSLNLAFNRSITDAGVRALLSARRFRPIHIGLQQTQLGDAGAEVLAAWPGLETVIDLDLTAVEMSDWGAAALAGSANWRDVRYLRVSRNNFGAQAKAQLCSRFGRGGIDIWGW